MEPLSSGPGLRRPPSRTLRGTGCDISPPGAEINRDGFPGMEIARSETSSLFPEIDMRLLLLLLGLFAVDTIPAVLAQSPWYGAPRNRWDGRGGYDYPEARLWVDDEREYLRRGERLNVRFSTSHDAYVAVIHVDTDGNLDFLYPTGPWDDDFVRGGRVYSLPRGHQSGWLVRSRPGIGYVYMIASPEPLDFRYFSGRRGGPWDWTYGGRTVQGDPFWAMEQITRLLVPDWPYVPYAVDHYSYYVEGRFRYPHYACADRYSATSRAWGWSSAYGACDRLDLFLRENPYYYDTRLYRGDRRRFFRDRYGDEAPSHGFKESPGAEPARGWDRSPRREAVPRAVPPVRREPMPRDVRPRTADPPDRRGATERRPALQRRDGERAGSGAAGTSATPRPAPRAEERRREPAASGRVAPRARRPGGDPPRDTIQFER